MNGTMSDNANELFPTVDDQGNVTGYSTASGIPHAEAT